MASPLDTLSSAHAPPVQAVGSSVLVAFVCATALLAGVGYIGAWNVQRVYGTNAAVAHTSAVQRGLKQLLATLIDAETGQRGFIITGDVKYLEPYESATGRLTQRIDDLRRLTADNSEQTGDLTVLAGIARIKLDELSDTIGLRRDLGFAAAQQRVQTDAGKHAMDDLRTIESRMEAREDQLLAVRTATADRGYRVALIADVASTSAAILTLIVLFAGIRRNALERHRSFIATAREREYLKVTLMGIGDGVIVTDRDARVSLMNPVAETLTGCPLKDAIGRPLRESFCIVNEQTRAAVENPVTRVLQTGTVQGLANHTVLIAADGTERAIDDSGAPIRNVDGEIVGAVLVFRDVTEKRRSAAALEGALHAAEDSRARLEVQESQLRDALRTRDEFVAMVSHELRNPINAVLGWAHMLREGTVGADRMNSAIASLDRNAQTLAKMIDDLLDLSRLSSGQLRMSVSEIDLCALLEEAIDAMRLGAESKGITLAGERAGQVPQILGDGNRLKQVIWNLVVNAIKFTPAGGTIQLALTASDSVVRLEVRDTGVGISPEFIPHVFERFRQADGSQDRSGLGLGLSIARHIVELHGGTIQAESGGVGQGARFLVTLPALGALAAGHETPLE